MSPMYWGITFFVLAILSGIKGYTNWFGPSLWVSQILTVIFVTLSILFVAAPSSDDPPLYRRKDENS